MLGGVLEVWLGTNKETDNPLRVSIEHGITDVGAVSLGIGKTGKIGRQWCI